jgi:RNA polymerase sigma-70 factor (family 1)
LRITTILLLPKLPAYNEKELLLLVSRGDENAFTQLFLQWHRLLAGYIFRITESKELTEEIVQDVFTKIWVIRETMTSINNFRHFLIVVSRNQAFDTLKKQLRAKELRLNWEKENEQEMITPDDDVETTRLSIIDKAIDSLPSRRKQIYLLSRHERLSYKQIAAELGISKESVKTHLKLAAGSITAFIRAHLGELSLLFFSFLKKY